MIKNVVSTREKHVHMHIVFIRVCFCVRTCGSWCGKQVTSALQNKIKNVQIGTLEKSVA